MNYEKLFVLYQEDNSRLQIVSEADYLLSESVGQYKDCKILIELKSLYPEKCMSRTNKLLPDLKSDASGYLVSPETLPKIINKLKKLNSQINDVIKSQTCHLCNYSSYLKNNFTKHVNTQSHKEAVLAFANKTPIGTQYEKVKEIGCGVIYRCKKCAYESTRKSSMENHLKRKTPCLVVHNLLPSAESESSNSGLKNRPENGINNTLTDTDDGLFIPLEDSDSELLQTESFRSPVTTTPHGEGVTSSCASKDYQTGNLIGSETDIKNTLRGPPRGYSKSMPNYVIASSGAPNNADSITLEQIEHSGHPISFSIHKHIKKYNNKQCPYCGREFSQRSNVVRHMADRCQVKKRQEAEKSQILEEYLRQMEEKDQRIRELETQLQQKPTTVNNHIDNSTNHQNNIGQVGDTTVKINSDNTINIQQNNHIQLLAFGKEDLDHLTKGAYKALINKGFASVPTMIDHVHFHDSLPQNHNIFISNLRDKYAMVFNGKGWVVTEQKEAINQLYEDKRYILEKEYEEVKDELNQFAIKRFKRFLSKDEDAREIKNVKGDIKKLLYNKRDIPKKTRKQMEKQPPLIAE